MSTGDFPRVGFGGGELKAGNNNGLQLSPLDALQLDSEGTMPVRIPAKQSAGVCQLLQRGLHTEEPFHATGTPKLSIRMVAGFTKPAETKDFPGLRGLDLNRRSTSNGQYLVTENTTGATKSVDNETLRHSERMSESARDSRTNILNGMVGPVGLEPTANRL